ncbi:MAG: peptidylprolyl isomerase [Magnetococcales bacterium]|nr:peptidylprolyl isomerase [Magnetococcales bacterium]
MSIIFRFKLILLCTALSLANIISPDSTKNAFAAEEKDKLPAFATVGDESISGRTYINTLKQAMREKFYHGNIPADQRAVFQREIGDKMVNRVLYLKEAEKLDVKPDDKEVQKRVDGYDKRYAKSKQWQDNRHKLLPPLIRELEARSRLKRLEEQIRNISEPSESAVLEYYKKNPEIFTEPMDQKVSLILLKVDRSADGSMWDEAKDEAAGLVEKLREGSDFAEMARIHSGDPSAENGGKMKYSHKGMLGDEAEKAIGKIQPGEITDPVVVLEGIAIFRLEDRTMPELVPFEDAKKRAKQLLIRNLSNKAWDDFTKRLRKETPFTINEEYYLPLPEKGDPTKGGHPPSPGGSTK